MDLNRFPNSITAAFLLTGFILLVLSVGPQVSAFSEGLNTSDTALFASGPRSVGSSVSAPGQYNDMGAAFLERGRDAIAGQVGEPVNVLRPRLNEGLPAVQAAETAQLNEGSAGFGDLQAFSASRLDASLSQQSLDAWAARYQGQADLLGAGASDAQLMLADWPATVKDAYYLAE